MHILFAVVAVLAILPGVVSREPLWLIAGTLWIIAAQLETITNKIRKR